MRSRAELARSRQHLRTVAALLACAALVPAGAEVLRMPIGVTPAGSPIRAVVASGALDPGGPTPRILLVGGLDGSEDSVDLAAALMRNPGDSGVLLSAVLNAFPDGAPVGAFPPEGSAYAGDDGEAHYLWRFLGMLAPDLVVGLRFSEGSGDLEAALQKGASPADVGRIPAATLRLRAGGKSLNELRREALERLSELARELQLSAARQALQGRLSRSPLETALQLEQAYGHALESAVYIPAVALIGRLRLGDLAGESRLADVERIASPFLEGKPSLGSRITGSHVSGHLVFAELHERTRSPAYLELARAAADLGFEPDGAPKASMPFHNEMSDSVFMGCAILARVGKLTGDDRYFRMALRHLRFMQSLDLRTDGLYRHSPLDHAAWGRGNGFPALGLALALTDWPRSEAGYLEVLEAYRSHMRALVRYQDPTGTWHQVIDRPESYREFSATAMIGFAVTRGLRQGWLSRREFEAVADRAWRAVLLRIKPDATLVDVCRSTGRQTSLRAYFDREAILGRDDRGGAMALLLATEREFWLRER